MTKEVLSKCGLFKGLTDQEALQLLNCLHGEKTVYEKNEILFRMGEPVTACALVLSGAVRAESVNSAGVRSVTAYHTPGALVGDVLMATPGGVSPVYVLAAERTEVLFLPFQRIMGGCEKCCTCHVRLRENLISEIAQKYWLQRRRIRYLSEKSLRERILLYLYDEADGRTEFQLTGTREDMADFLCVNRSALSRELSRMKAEGIVDLERKQIRLVGRNIP